MATRKNRPVLYEVVRRTRGVVVPAWLRKSTSTSQAGAAAPATPPAQVPATAPPASPALSRRWLQVTGGVVRIELSWPWVAATGAALVVVLWLVFQAGLRTGRGTATTGYGADLSNVLDEPARLTAREPVEVFEPRPDHRPPAGQPVATPVPPTPQPRPTPAAEPPAASPGFTFKPGFHYVVVQHFRKSQMDLAQKAAAFLTDRGIPCVIEAGSDLRVIATEPFDLQQKDSKARDLARQRLEALKERIRTLGKEFARDYGYAFEQCYAQQRAK